MAFSAPFENLLTGGACRRRDSLVVPQGPAETEESTEPTAAAKCEIETAQARRGRISWARLLKRVFDIEMQHCPA